MSIDLPWELYSVAAHICLGLVPFLGEGGWSEWCQPQAPAPCNSGTHLMCRGCCKPCEKCCFCRKPDKLVWRIVGVFFFSSKYYFQKTATPILLLAFCLLGTCVDASEAWAFHFPFAKLMSGPGPAGFAESPFNFPLKWGDMSKVCRNSFRGKNKQLSFCL